MRELKKFGWGAALLMGFGWNLVGSAAEPGAAETPPAKKSEGVWFGGWFSPKDKPPDKDKKPAKGVKADAAPKAAPADETAAQRAKEQATLLRRLAVCDQLRAVASRTQDDALSRQADELDERVWETYTRRINRLPAVQAEGELARTEKPKDGKGRKRAGEDKP